ncbi:MAG TPA: hypothetical protein VFH44_11470 [Solirubrobacterales bacterium]|nr:hypothetical protein [Solirubrobacterales bacterium]
MARVLALVSDLMLASRVEAPLAAAGHEVTVSSDPGAEAGSYDVVVADLELVDPALIAAAGPPAIGFYSHVDVATRRRAEAAGLDLVVPRSRMARELPELVAAVLERGR